MVNSILSMTLRQYWFNVLLVTLNAYFKMQLSDRGHIWFTWDNREDKFDGIFLLFRNVVDIWATYDIKDSHFTPSDVRYQCFSTFYSEDYVS